MANIHVELGERSYLYCLNNLMLASPFIQQKYLWSATLRIEPTSCN